MFSYGYFRKSVVFCVLFQVYVFSGAGKYGEIEEQTPESQFNQK